MELRHLRYFLGVAEALHFGRAARRLHVSQPTVSQQIKQLEEELGAPLFERGERGVRLTQAGETFRGYATRALEDVHAGARAIAALEALDVGTLRIGFLPSLTAGLVVPASAAVRRKYPGLRVEAYEAVTRRVERRVAMGKVDVGLAYAPSREPDVETEPVFERRLALVVPARHRLAGVGRTTIGALADAPFALLAPGMRVRAMIDAFLARTRFAPRVVLEANAVATVLAMVRAGLAVTLLPEARFAEAERLAVVALSPAPPSHFVALLWRRGGARTAAAIAFADEVRALGATPRRRRP